MAALIGPRLKRRRSVDRDMCPIGANVKGYEGAMACIDLANGNYVPGKSGLGLLAVGQFYEECDNTGGAAGALLAHIQFSQPPFRECWENDTANPVTEAMRGQVCYILDDHTVTALGTNRSVAGRVMKVTAEFGVEVVMASLLGPQGEPGEDA